MSLQAKFKSGEFVVLGEFEPPKGADFSHLLKNAKQIKGRVFEIPMCGGFLLTEYVEGLEEWFRIDAEIACFAEVGEAVEKIRHYLSHEEERRQVAESGYRRAIDCHSWNLRLIEVFQIIQGMEAEALSATRPGLMEQFANKALQR